MVTSLAPSALAQNNPEATDNTVTTQGNKLNKVVVITGARFCYPLVQKWIDDYYKVNPNIQIIIESRGSSDPAQYDILVEVHDHAEEIKKNREYVFLARYAVLPVANSKSTFAKVYAEKGLTQELINQLFFHDLYADKKEQEVKAPYTIYTRLQRAGVPIVFTHYFGYDQKDIKGKAIAGSDEHLLKALLRDSTGISYLPLTLIYDRVSGQPLPGITVLPVDLNGNGRISDDEKFYDRLPNVIKRLESKDVDAIHNIPIAYVHLSVDKQHADPAAIEFITWVISHGQNDLHDFGYLKPEPGHFEKEKIERFASKRN